MKREREREEGRKRSIREHPRGISKKNSGLDGIYRHDTDKIRKTEKLTM